MTRFQVLCLAVLGIAVATSCIAPPYPQEMALQHSPTVALLVALPLALRRWPLSNAAVAGLVAFLLLHTLGARYIYSNVPYELWAHRWLRLELAAVFGWRRNHYDRLVHFAFGLLWVRLVYELLVRHLRLSGRVALYVTVEFVLATSALYELFEWGLTMVLSPEDANEYNGQQGDLWDAQKDMGLALVGAFVGVALTVLPFRLRPAAAGRRPA